MGETDVDGESGVDIIPRALTLQSDVHVNL